jgi:hypothetical protein
MIVVPLDFVLHTFGFLGKSDEVATQILSKQATSLLRFAADAGGLQIIKIQKGVFIEDEENPAEESSSAEIICAFEADSCCVTDPGTAGNMLLKVKPKKGRYTKPPSRRRSALGHAGFGMISSTHRCTCGETSI